MCYPSNRLCEVLRCKICVICVQNAFTYFFFTRFEGGNTFKLHFEYFTFELIWIRDRLVWYGLIWFSSISVCVLIFELGLCCVSQNQWFFYVTSFSFDYIISYSSWFVSGQVWHLISFCKSAAGWIYAHIFCHSSHFLRMCRWARNVSKIKTPL